MAWSLKKKRNRRRTISHVVKTNIQFKSLTALRKALEACGLEFRENQQRYKWFGSFVGDSPMPEGFTWTGKTSRHTYDPKKRMLGTCEHAAGIRGNRDAYEVGVYQKEDGTWGLIWDWYQGGGGLQAHLGGQKDAKKIEAEYAMQLAVEVCQQQAWYYEIDGKNVRIYHPDGGIMTVGVDGVEASQFIGSKCTEPVMLLSEALGKVAEVHNTSGYYEQEVHLTQPSDG